MQRVKLLPRDCLLYHGHRTVQVVLIVLSAISTARSLVHILLPDGGSTTIAGLTVDPSISGPLVYTFAWAGLYQLLFAGVQWLVLLRYKGLIPLLSLAMLFEQVGLWVLPRYKPLVSSGLAHTPPEVIGNMVLLPLLLVVFIASQVPGPGQDAVRHESRSGRPGGR